MSAILAIGCWTGLAIWIGCGWWRQSYNRRAEARAQRWLTATDELDSRDRRRA